MDKNSKLEKYFICKSERTKQSYIYASNIWDKLVSKECSDTMASTFIDFIKFSLNRDKKSQVSINCGILLSRIGKHGENLETMENMVKIENINQKS